MPAVARHLRTVELYLAGGAACENTRAFQDRRRFACLATVAVDEHAPTGRWRTGGRRSLGARAETGKSVARATTLVQVLHF